MRINDFPFKLAAVDIDDTLVGRDKRIGHENRLAVEQLIVTGCRVVLASGRRHENMLRYSRELGLDDFVVSSQGALVRHVRTGEIIHRALLAPPEAAEVTALGLARGVSVLHWAGRGVLAQEQSRWTDRYTSDCSDPVAITDLRALRDEPAEKIVWGADPGVISALAPEMRRRYRGRMVVTVTDDWFLEFASTGATKAAGVAAISDRYGIEQREVLAFGDGNNDAALLAWAGLGVAMSHARPAAQAAAKRVAPEGDPESGLARAVEAVFAAHAFDKSRQAGRLDDSFADFSAISGDAPEQRLPSDRPQKRGSSRVALLGRHWPMVP
jgi:Cof subfamily protein (haloacid dehalogenase superfamily)